MIHRGDVWWANVPADKVRPVLVLTRERFVSRLGSLMVAPVTTTVRDIPTEVRLTKDDGLPRECAANFDNLFTLHRSRFQQRITRLAVARMQEACHAYRFAAECG